MKIYKITKPNTNEVYIGQTKLTLKERLRKHFSSQIKRQNTLIYKWLTNDCIIELIEEFDSIKKDCVKEMLYVQEYLNNGFILKNIHTGNYILNKENYNTIQNTKNKESGYFNEVNKKNKESGYTKEMNKKLISNRHNEYNNWLCMITRKAKKEGITGKQYRIKYNIQDYNGPKKINN